MKTFNHRLIAAALAFAFASVASAQQRVEYFWDSDPGVGKGKTLQAFEGDAATVETQLDASSLAAGIHTLGVRALNGRWFSQTYHRQFYIPPVEEQITRIEYAWDAAPAPGMGTAIDFTAGSTIDISEQLSVAGLKSGLHTLYVQALTGGDHRSLQYCRQFYVPPTPHTVTAIEYFFDQDPGVGKGTRMAAATKDNELTTSFTLDVSGLSDGVHHIGLRTLTDGTWSATMTRQFLVHAAKENEITRLEYFWNDDPGAGEGHAVDIVPGEEVELEFLADMTELGPGPHTLGLRAKAGTEGWSTTWKVSDIEFEGWDVLQDYILSLVDTHDVLDGGKYERQYKNHDWHALYVPFSLSYSDWQLHFDVARINAFYQYDDDEDGVVDRQVLEAIMVKPGSGNLKPNHPYLIRSRDKGTFSFNVGSRLVDPVENSVSCSTLEAKYTFTGNYADLTGLNSAQRYRLRGNALSIPDTDDEVLPPYRWYVTIDDLGNQLELSAASVRLRIVGDEEQTALGDQLFDEGELVGHRKVYDLQGRRISVSADTPLRQLPRGIYVINHKKYIAR